MYICTLSVIGSVKGEKSYLNFYIISTSKLKNLYMIRFVIWLGLRSKINLIQNLLLKVMTNLTENYVFS